MAKYVGTLADDYLRGTADINEIWGDTFKGLIAHQVGGNDSLVGGSGNDTIIGDAADLADFAKGGDDVIYGDPLSTGSIHSTPPGLTGLGLISSNQLTPIPLGGTQINSDDVLYGDALQMHNYTTGGNDEIYGQAGNDTIYGDAHDMFDHAIGGMDSIRGGTGSDTIYGDAYMMSGNTQGGADWIMSGELLDASTIGRAHVTDGNDTVYGDAWKMTDFAKGGDDTIFGGEGNDVIYGDAFLMSGSSTGGNDFICGGAGDDYLYGDAYGMTANVTGGNDTLCGGAGNDHLWGGKGADVFQFVEYTGPGGALLTNTGTDYIHDFSHAEGDKIEIATEVAFRFSDLNITENSNHDAVIHLLEGSTVTVIGVHANQLTASDFWFG